MKALTTILGCLCSLTMCNSACTAACMATCMTAEVCHPFSSAIMHPCKGTCTGLRDGMPIEEQDQTLLQDILAVVFEGVDEAVIKEAMTSRVQRRYD
jgi:hypothetical protein